MQPPEPAEFEAIRQGLTRFSVVEVATAVGVSKSMGRQIRSGALVPICAIGRPWPRWPG